MTGFNAWSYVKDILFLLFKRKSASEGEKKSFSFKRQALSSIVLNAKLIIYLVCIHLVLDYNEAQKVGLFFYVLIRNHV